MRILLLHQYYCPRGGYGNDRTRAFAEAWATEGQEVTVITSTAYCPPHHPAWRHRHYVAVEGGVTLHFLRVRYHQAASARQKLRAFAAFALRSWVLGLRLPKPSVIYACSTPPSVGEVGRLLSRWRGVPFLFEAIDVWPDVPIGMGLLRNPLLIRLLHGFVNRIYRQAQHIITLSEGMRAQILRHGVPWRKLSVLHNGTDPRLFAPRPAPQQARPATAPVQLLYAGAVGRANDAGQLLAALARMQERYPELAWQLTFRAWGQELEALQARATALGLTAVAFKRPLPKAELAQVMATADIGVVTVAPYPVLEANSANKFFDYLAAGLPVAINYEGWQAAYLQEFDAGRSAPQGDQDSFAEILAELIGAHELRARLRPNARRLAEQHFDRQTLARQALRRLRPAADSRT